MNAAIVLHGDSADVLRTLETESAHALVTDPPAGISLHGLEWDGDKGGQDAWVAWLADILREAHRVLKPGAHGLVWAFPRTSHWTARACELAGFEVRDVIVHAFAYRMPHGIDMATAIDRRLGRKRKVVGHRMATDLSQGFSARGRKHRRIEICDASSTVARRWRGWQTAMRQATEHWILIRKAPRCASVDALLEHGTCALNSTAWCAPSGSSASTLVLEHTDRCGSTRCAPACVTTELGSAARLFYAHRPSVEERDAGCEKLPRRALDGALDAQGRTNFHASPKPLGLMRRLVRLITPPGGVVLDAFAGSGTTGAACMLEGARFVGVERDLASVRVARARVAYWRRKAGR